MAKPIKIEIVGDDRSIRQAFGNTEAGIGRLLGPLATMGTAIAGAFAVDRLVSFGGELLGLATNIGNITNKVNTVFGDQADKMAVWADRINEQFGVTSQGVQLMAANIADLLKPMGFSTEAAAGMSRELTELSPALAQWTGGTHDAARVSEILAKAILGEREELKSLGISISQAEVNARALIVAQQDGRTAVTDMDEALATQQLIFEKSTDAQAGYTASTDTLTGQQNLLKARLAELKEELATRLTPVFLRFGNFLVSLVPRVKALADTWLPKLRAAAVAVGTWFRDTLVPVMRRIADDVLPVVADVVANVWTVFREGFDWIRDHKEALVGFGVILATMFGAWAVSAGAAAVATLAAAAPLIALGVAIGALAVIVRKAYDEHEGFRRVVDRVATFMRDTLWPAMKNVGAWIRDTLIPIIADVAVKLGEWVITAANVAADILSYIDDIVGFVADLATGIAGTSKDIYDAVTGGFRDAFDWVIRRINDVISAWNALPLGVDIAPINGPSSGSRPLGSGTPSSGSRPLGGGGNRPVRGSRAWGGDTLDGGWFDVGERGRERVFLPGGARVAPAHATTSGGGDSYTIVGYQLSPAQLAREIAWRRRLGDGR